MKLSASTLTLALLPALAAPAAHAEIAIDFIGGSELTFEGLVQVDGNWFNSDVANLNGDGYDGADSDNELRRAELILKGKGPGNFEWTLGYDAKADKYLDVNTKYKFGGNGNHYLQVGQFKQPNSMEELSSTRFNDFISKATITNTYALARRTGVAYRYGENNWGVTGSWFGRTINRGAPIQAASGIIPESGSEGHGGGLGIRGNWAPINETGNILHLGLSYMAFDTSGDTSRIRARPNGDLASVRLVDSGVMRNTSGQDTLGVEGMWVHGAFKVQGEYMRSTISRYDTVPVGIQSGDDFRSDGWYVSGLWNVTGETWGYKEGVPTTPLPNEPVKGLWQIGLRYDKIDLNDGYLSPGSTPGSAPKVNGVLGGEMNAVTFGVNWFWRSNFKFALNYVDISSSRYNSSARAVVNDDPSIVEARIQFYW